ncbi:TPA: restriction endonuclease subunit S [Streptococcus suis]
MTKEKPTEPRLRFPGFTDAWKQRKLGELATFAKGNGYSKKDLVAEGAPIILYGRLYTKYETIISEIDTFVSVEENKNSVVYSEGGEVLVPASGESSLDIARASVVAEKGIILGGDLNIVRLHSEIFPVYLAVTISNGKQQKDLSKRAQGKSVVHLHNSDLKEVDLNFPTLPEQEAIGSFFSDLDQLITLHQRKLDSVKGLKKALLQKMFPKGNGNDFPELRFPEFTDAWKQRKLGEVLDERNESRSPSADVPLVSFTVENGVTPKTERYNREFLVRDDDKKYKFTQLDDIVYNPANLKFGAIARNKYGAAVFSPIYITYTVIPDASPVFIELVVTFADFIQRALRYQEGTVYERMAVKSSDLLRSEILLPTLSEQEAIGSFFSDLDQLITLHQRQLDHLKLLKKALLQQMFI